ncbi:MAG TPA: Ig-like domain-containing protein, partial [Gemmatimonadales bacterium]|nr:Ig-like domain-containing protein [Gemmatimonadales bacterium]
MSRKILVLAAALAAACNSDPHHSGTGPETQVASILVLPDTVTVDPLAAWQFSAFGRTAAGDSIALDLDWSASAGSITPDALFTADSSEDDVTITAALRSPGGNGVRGLAHVRKRRFVQLILTPPVDTLLPGGTQQFTTSGVRPNRDTIPMTPTYTATGGTITADGLYTADSVPGNFLVIASRRTLADTAFITIRPPPVARVAITPDSAVVYVGKTLQLTVITKDAHGGILTGRTVTWSSNATGVATVSATGMVEAIAPGSATISATSEGITGNAKIAVTLVPVATVTLTPSSALIHVGKTVQFVAAAMDSAGSVLTGRQVTWSSSAPNIATVSSPSGSSANAPASPPGLVTAMSAGRATITATIDGVSSTADITVLPVPVASVTVTPSSALLRIGTSVQLTATMKDSAGDTLSGRIVIWTSNAPLVASVSLSGRVTAMAVGTATITATSEGQSGTSAITVTVVPVANVTVTPSASTINAGSTVQLTAVTKDSAGNVLDGRPVTWASDDPNV